MNISPKCIKKKLANLITFELYIMYRLSELRISNKLREFKFSLHVNYELYIESRRAKMKLNFSADILTPNLFQTP